MPPLASPDLRRAGLTLGLLALLTVASDHLAPTRPLVGLLLGAVAVDALATRAGAGYEIDGRGLLRGAALGLGAALAASALGAAAGQARWLVWGPDLLGAGMALASAAATSVRDELALRWAPARLLSSSAPPWALGALSAALGAAHTLGLQGPRWPAIALSAALGLLSFALLRRTGSLSASLGAATALRLLASPTPLGVEVRWARGSLAPLEAASGPGAWWLSLALVAASLAVALAWPAAPQPGDQQDAQKA